MTRGRGADHRAFLVDACGKAQMAFIEINAVAGSIATMSEDNSRGRMGRMVPLICSERPPATFGARNAGRSSHDFPVQLKRHSVALDAVIHKAKELVTGKNRNRRHGCGEWSFVIESKPEVVGPRGNSGGHRGGTLWLFGEKIGGLTFIRFEVIQLGFAAVRVDQEFPAAVAHRESGTLVLRFATLENRVRMAVLPEHGLWREG